MSCSERCTSPLHRRGTCGDSVLCVERPVDESNCCVLVVRQDESPSSPCQDTECGPRAECRHEIRGDGGGEPETICVCQEGYTGDPDSEEGCALATTKDGSPKVGDSPACRYVVMQNIIGAKTNGHFIISSPWRQKPFLQEQERGRNEGSVSVSRCMRQIRSFNHSVAASCHKTKLILLHSAYCAPCHTALHN